MMKKIVMTVLILLLLLPAMVFAGGRAEAEEPVEVDLTEGKYSPEEKVTLEFWHSYTGPRAKLFETLIGEFMEANPMIEVKLTYGGSLHVMRDKLMTAIAGNAAPDVAEIDSFWTPFLAEANALYDVKPFIEASGYNQGDLVEASLQSTQYKGQSFSIPFNLSNIVLYYNKAKFKEAGLDPAVPPTTWEELIEYGKKLTVDKNNDGVIDQWGLAMPLKANFGAVWYWLAHFWQQEGQLFNAELTEATFNSPAGVAATNLWRDMVWKHKILSLSTGFADFSAGNAAMEYSSSSTYGGYKDSLGRANVGVTTAPKGLVEASVSGGGNLAILQGSKDPRAAWELIYWLGSPEVNTRWCIVTGALPVWKTVLETQEYKDYMISDPNVEIMLAGLDSTIVRPNIAQYSDASRIIAEAVEKAVFENLDPKPLLDQAKKDVDALF
ncbi:MAG: ABC transporter substrate-binding protein [Spirochaetales bacterium]|nr:ABC transporter substrate-binding protein [Spirochaetales bacterium]